MTRKRQLRTNREPLWADLLSDDIWQYIGFKLSVADRLRFRAVCKTWMSLIPSRPPPWLVLSESVDGSDQHPFDRKPAPPRRGLVSLGVQSVTEFHFPALHRSRCVGSSGNWIITAHSDASLRLVNPFDERQILLPSAKLFDNDITGDPVEIPDEDFDLPQHDIASIAEFVEEFGYLGNVDVEELYRAARARQLYKLARERGEHDYFNPGSISLWKIVLDSSPSKWRDCAAMAIHDSDRTLAYTKLGCYKWFNVEIVDPPEPCYVEMVIAGQTFPFSSSVEIDDVVYYNDHFYAITNRGELLFCDGDGIVDPPKAWFLSGPVEDFSILRINYLVEWMGELLMVSRTIGVSDNGLIYRTTKFETYKFDFEESKWNELKSLGEYSLFLGFNTSVALCANGYASGYFEFVKRNCIYFTDNFVMGYVTLSEFFNISSPFGHDMGVFDLENRCVKPHFSGSELTSTSPYSTSSSPSLLSPPVWLVPPERDSRYRDNYNTNRRWS